jgi:hypothetical protein
MRRRNISTRESKKQGGEQAMLITCVTKIWGGGKCLLNPFLSTTLSTVISYDNAL